MPILCFCKSLKLLIDSGLECFKFLFVSSPHQREKSLPLLLLERRRIQNLQEL